MGTLPKRDSSSFRDGGAPLRCTPRPKRDSPSFRDGGAPLRCTPRPKLIATDLDGTLLREDRTVSARTAETLDRMAAAGIRVVVVTGRPVRWLAGVFDQLKAPLPAVCANGAVVYDPFDDVILRADPLAPDLLAEVARRLRAEIPGVIFAVEVEDGRQMLHDAGWPSRWDLSDPSARLVDLPDDLLTVPAVKLLCRAGQQDPDVFVKVVAGAIAGLAEATHSSRSGLVEISAAGVTKAAGLAWLCERYGVDASEVVAFGDMPNDLPMLTWAGTAVAVANAHESVRAVADHTTLSHEQDGVATYLEKLLADAE